EPPTAVVGSPTYASVLYYDFESRIQARLQHAARVSARSRWGLGTTQYILNRDGSCRLLQRYGGAQAVILSRAASSYVIHEAARRYAYPWVTDSSRVRSPLKQWRVRFLVPGGPLGWRWTESQQVRLRHGSLTSPKKQTQARCGRRRIDRVFATGTAIERVVEKRAHESADRPSRRARSGPAQGS
ncbi:MAG: hypothetical protein QOJ03_498, partial [Frankiaceae bacterium]|nr:hypothetical protein [Frankiaceae bacterium]